MDVRPCRRDAPEGHRPRGIVKIYSWYHGPHADVFQKDLQGVEDVALQRSRRTHEDPIVTGQSACMTAAPGRAGPLLAFPP
eukprot:3771512-Pyramimonas_sp.AAC.1